MPLTLLCTRGVCSQSAGFQGLKKQCLCAMFPARVILIISEAAEVQCIARSLALFLHTSPSRAEM